MSTLQKMTEDWRAAVGSDWGLGDKRIKYDLRRDGVILIDRNSVTKVGASADLTFSAKIDVIENILAGRVNASKAMRRGKLKITPMSAALKLQRQIAALLERLPKDGSTGVVAAEETEADVDPPLGPRSSEMTLFSPEMFDLLRPDNFVAHPDFPGPVTARYQDRRASDGRTCARTCAQNRSDDGVGPGRLAV